MQCHRLTIMSRWILILVALISLVLLPKTSASSDHLAAPLSLFSSAVLVTHHDVSSPHHEHPVQGRFAASMARTVHAAHLHPHLRNTNLLLHEIPVLKVLSADMVPDLGPIYGRVVSVSHSDDGAELMIIGRVVDSPDTPLSAEDRLAGSPSHFAAGGRFTLHVSHSGEHVSGEVSLFDHDTAFRWETNAEAGDGHVLLRRIHIDEHICRQDAIPPSAGDSDYDPAQDTIATRVLNPPSHNSKPGSPYVIFLDFDGHDASGSAWGDIVAGPYDIDSNTNSFSTTELTRISQIWELMAEDYAPFEITVTTIESVYNAVSESRRVRCVFTITDAWYPNAGGVAYVGVFSRPSNNLQPSWVFTKRLSGGSSKSCGEAGSHEVGHNMGLSHDGTSSVGYYTGHGSGITGWGPIMGVGYYQDLIQWSRGEYADANEQQDDLAIVGGSSNGFGFRADDHGDTLALATTLTDGATPAGAGYISTRADVDYFTITLGASGSMTFTIQPTSTNYYNLDIEARLYADSSLVSTVNPSADVKAIVTYSGVAGTTYHLRVDGVGKGSATGAGYTDYGSLGEYEILYSGPASGSGSVCGNSIVEAGEQCDPPSQACCTSTCQFRPSSYTCRSAVGVCDVAETCTGSSAGCPANAVATAGTTCRASTGPCDVAETCNGASTSCPANGFRSTVYVCRASAGVCDVAETCTGSSASCPADSFQPTSVVCRASTGVCDLAETCTGSSAPCPANSFAASGTSCDDGDVCSSPDSCNGAGICSGPSICACGNGVVEVGEQCDDGNLVSGDCCSSSCQIESLGTVCRAAAGPCDVAETCDGTTPTCPGDVLVSTGIVCREVAGVCDVAETCTGTSASCPADNFVSSATVCRFAAGVCDVAESCTGSSPLCPANARRAGEICRPAAGSLCDQPEVCSSSSDDCPPDTFLPSGTPCNNGAACDGTSDTCDGTGPNSCVGSNPAGCVFTCGDGVVEPGEQCDDGNTVNGDCCSATCQFESSSTPCATASCNGMCNGAGSCITQPFCCLTDAQCDDGRACTIDTCGSDEVCHNDPAPAGTSCDDQQDCTINDVCSGVDGVCRGENSCPAGCGLHGICCHSACECMFGWDSEPTCSIGPDPLSLGFPLESVVNSEREGRAFTVLLPGGVDVVISVTSASSATAGTRAASGVYLYGSFSEIPNRASGLVIHEYTSERAELETHSFVVNSTRSGLLFVSVFRADGVTGARFQITAAEPGTGAAAPSPSVIAATAGKAWIWAALAGGLLLCIVVVVVVVLVIRARAHEQNIRAWSTTSRLGTTDDELTDMAGFAVGKPMASASATSPLPMVNDAPLVTIGRGGTTSRRYRALYDFNGRQDDELTFCAGDKLVVQESYDDGWGLGHVVGSLAEGIFPMTGQVQARAQAVAEAAQDNGDDSGQAAAAAAACGNN
ncbi:uncharacterized protein AMSG_10016 [Thecamonas trahens ATCC 50062]|uniref:Disintegrin domain-containing protein n=1 Tax=Thecamonas trahens ATCC 50062 TaxID=461836 RepID=A0A0L0DPI9_THETB|nr:hypothetical protein AMSG_10016 [Thecamonas trahens ATCC 50062]KNC54224.1 hypothetical protein AMSG_10016 [Thecamonas trahens ATCC 50062]|eukprot:XP_013753862.1 hypothetical protein AMSG_10016 [Thecamonas trahens ATCC 50062]